MDLEDVLVLCKEIRQAYNALKQEKNLNCDSDMRHLLKQRFQKFSDEYPQLYSFLCSSSTNEQNVMDMQRTIKLKIMVLKGTISDEVGKEKLLQLLKSANTTTTSLPAVPTWL